MKTAEYNLHFDKILACGRVGEALNKKLREYPCPNYCPTEVQEVINTIVEEMYEKGYTAAQADVHSVIFGWIHGSIDESTI